MADQHDANSEPCVTVTGVRSHVPGTEASGYPASCQRNVPPTVVGGAHGGHPGNPMPASSTAAAAGAMLDLGIELFGSA
jgi:hypothetical protein